MRFVHLAHSFSTSIKTVRIKVDLRYFGVGHVRLVGGVGGDGPVELGVGLEGLEKGLNREVGI